MNQKNSTLSKVFDRIAQAITSLGAVVFVMLMTITSMIFFSHTLFGQVFPATMDTWERRLATWAMALGWEFTVLITTVNTKHINRNIPSIMAVCSGFIVLFFIQAFDGNMNWLQLLQRWFVGLLAATINYIYAELFYSKWQERSISQSTPGRLMELESVLNERDRTVNELQSKLKDVQSRINETDSELKLLRALRKQVDADRTCPYCDQVQANPNALRAHKGHCIKNPININA